MSTRSPARSPSKVIRFPQTPVPFVIPHTPHGWRCGVIYGLRFQVSNDCFAMKSVALRHSRVLADRWGRR